MKIKLTIPGQPPRTTAQEHKVYMAGGRPHFYKPAKLKQAEKYLLTHLVDQAPTKPIQGAVILDVTWRFAGRGHKDGEPKVTRPDTDNLQKLLKDCLTDAGFWTDDAQVTEEHVRKMWSRDPGIEIVISTG